MYCDLTAVKQDKKNCAEIIVYFFKEILIERQLYYFYKDIILIMQDLVFNVLKILTI